MTEPIIIAFNVRRLEASLNQPFRIAVGQHDSLHNVLLTLEIKGGIKGFGEAAVATHITGETIEETIANLKSIGQLLIGKDAGDYLNLAAHAREHVGSNKCALAAVEMALLDLLTKQFKIPLWRLFGTRAVPLKSDITIVIGSVEEAGLKSNKFYKQGFRSFKIKVGREHDQDVARVQAVCRNAPKSDIILDANQGYSATETLKFLKELKALKITPVLIEQPVPKGDWEGLKRVTRLSTVPVCADESVSSLKSAAAAIREHAVDAINIKFMKTGILEAREIARLAAANGIKLMIGGMMESNLAMTASAHMAAGLNCFDYVDLDTPFFIKNHVAKNPFLNSAGVYRFKDAPAGIGIRP